jgi:penicillin-binding protein 1A
MADVFLDSPVVYPDPVSGKTWRPLNFSGKFRGPTTLHTALMYSINVVTIKLLEKLGVQAAVNMAHRLGISTPIKNPNYSLGLGTYEVTLSEMVQAYSVFANQGIRVEPFGILTVKDNSGKIIENNSPVGQEVLDPQTAYIMVNTMKDVIDRGTGRAIRKMGFTYPAAGKTGTTNDNVDAWFIGFTPDLTCGVWVGYDERQSLGKKQTGGEAAAPIWAEFMKAATEGKPVKDFPTPQNFDTEFVKKKVCLDSGLLASVYCPHTQDEIFKKETAPTKICNLHTGNGAEVHNPSENGNTNPSSGGDILEMDSQPVQKTSAPSSNGTPATSASEGTSETGAPKKTNDMENYPDQGF